MFSVALEGFDEPSFMGSVGWQLLLDHDVLILALGRAGLLGGITRSRAALSPGSLQSPFPGSPVWKKWDEGEPRHHSHPLLLLPLLLLPPLPPPPSFPVFLEGTVQERRPVEAAPRFCGSGPRQTPDPDCKSSVA